MNKIEEPTSWTIKISATPERQTALTATAIIPTETTTAEPDTSIPKEVPTQKMPKKRTAQPAIRPSEAEEYMDEEENMYDDMHDGTHEEKEQGNNSTTQYQFVFRTLVSHWREEKHKYINFTEILRKLEEERRLHPNRNNGQQGQRFKDFLSHVETTITDEDFKSVAERHKISGLADIFSFGSAILLMMDKRDKSKKYRSMLTELLEIPKKISFEIPRELFEIDTLKDIGIHEDILKNIPPKTNFTNEMIDGIIEFLEKYSDGSTSDALTTDVKELLRSIDKKDLENEEINHFQNMNSTQNLSKGTAKEGFEKFFKDHPKVETIKNLYFHEYENEHGPITVASIKDKLKSFRNSVDKISYVAEDYAKYVQEKEKRRIITHVGLDNTQSSKGSQYKNPTFLSIIFLVLIVYQINN
ncbi:hypothetical protein QYM36_018984 [Artemia franciscana]|uniref:Uncharacterized protein n=1 Tax=Artemia franciscana TaxID=6661 RepID=A0AA88KZW5_ARTSF|nr:hypothetical protein QYM36_018984 [Artemia franciscana]